VGKGEVWGEQKKSESSLGGGEGKSKPWVMEEMRSRGDGRENGDTALVVNVKDRTLQ